MNYTFDSTIDNGVSFEQWLRLADRYCIGLAGVGLSDLPDTLSRDAYEAGDTPRDHVDDALLDNAFPFPEGHRYHTPAPAPVPAPTHTSPRYALAPQGQWLYEDIHLENGRTITVRRPASANGKGVQEA